MPQHRHQQAATIDLQVSKLKSVPQNITELAHAMQNASSMAPVPQNVPGIHCKV
jgi:hypothetical protein